MNERIGIKKTILLTDGSESHPYIGKFTITSKMPRAGASALCYQVKNPRGIQGVLKEFYPESVASLVRNEHEQLVHLDGMEEEKEKFTALQKEYLEPYRMLSKARENDDLATVIPPYEILYGCDEDGNVVGTSYIWTPVPAYYSFEEMISAIHEDLSDRPEYKLVQILHSLESLVKSVEALHSTGLVHRDINPSNFGFRKLGKDVLTQTISLFDVDTVCSVYRVPEIVRGSEGFLEPEYEKDKANNLTDIFAIGATLFQAIVVTDETKKNNCRYDYHYYSRLSEMLDASEFLQEMEINLHPDCKEVLLRILRKTLCLRDERYRSCEELLKDIQTVLYYIVPMEMSEKVKAGKKWKLAEVEKYYGKSEEKNITLAIQHHLYQNPLYMNLSNQDDSKDTLELLIIGFDMFAQKFLDQALQISQVMKQYLNVRIVFEHPEEKEKYLRKRPEIRNFFNIEDSVQEGKESYGTISFVESAFPFTKSEEIHQYISELYHDESPDYTYISTGEDKQNLVIAQSLKVKSPVCLTWMAKRHVPAKMLHGVIPVYVLDDVQKLSLVKEIERMAFNVHLIWNKNLNIKFQEVRKEYRKPYNRYSCISFVVAMKHKLHSIGVDIDKMGVKEAARKYNARKADTRNEWICSEHKRWVAEKICLGYQAITDLEYCATGLMKDEKNKRHVCLVRSTPEMSLSSKTWFQISRKQPVKDKWDHPSSKELETLDELDRMSVELHGMFLRLAEAEREHNLLNGRLVSELRSQIEGDNKCVIVWQELITCMKDIWDNDIRQYHRYKGLRTKLSDRVKGSKCLNERDKASINKLLDSLHERFYPIWESSHYRDYKLDDVKLVEGIPFILTYSESIYMVIPYRTGSNDEIFSNLAAPTHANPSVILYYAYCSSVYEMESIKKTLPYIFSFMEKKEFRAKVELVIGCKGGSAATKMVEITRSIKDESDGRVKQISLIDAQSPKKFAEKLNEYLNQRSRNKMNFHVECDALLAGVVGSSPRFSTYTYDSRTMKFTSIHDADNLSYIQKEPFITVTDMFALRQASSETSNKPEFLADYKELWKLYKTNTWVWKNLCGTLAKRTAENDKIASFAKKDGTHVQQEYRYIIPFSCKKAVQKVLAHLIEEKIIAETSCIHTITTNSCEVLIQDLTANRLPFDILFTRVYKLMDENYVKCAPNPNDHTVTVYYDELYLANIPASLFTQEERSMLNSLKDSNFGYLVNLREHPNGTLSFSFATRQIKELLTIAGKLLEIYVYSMAYESGDFDDIRSGFEIDWKNHIAKNELDAVMTKGFSTLFVECKATKCLKREYYDKLVMLTHNFGINAKVVIVADTEDTPETQEKNDEMRAYGEELGIITISDRCDIGNIGLVMLSLLKK